MKKLIALLIVIPLVGAVMIFLMASIAITVA